MPNQKLSPADARTNLIKRNKLKKMLKEEMNLLKESTDESKVRQYYEKLINLYIILSFEAITTNMKELEAINYLEKHKPPEPQAPLKVTTTLIIGRTTSDIYHYCTYTATHTAVYTTSPRSFTCTDL